MNTSNEKRSSDAALVKIQTNLPAARTERELLAIESDNAKKAIARTVRALVHAAPHALNPVRLWRRHPVGTTVGIAGGWVAGGALAYRYIRRRNEPDSGYVECACSSDDNGSIWFDMGRSLITSLGGALISRALLSNQDDANAGGDADSA